MDVVSAGLLLAVATGATEAAGGIVWESLSSLVRRRFKGKKRRAAVEHLERLQLNRGDADAATQLASALTTRAAQDAAFRAELESWQASALRLYPTANVITGGTQGSVVQAGSIIGDVTFNFTPPAPGAAATPPGGTALLPGQDAGLTLPPGVLIQIREAGIRLPPQPYRSLAGLPMRRRGFTARRADLRALLGALDPDKGEPVVAVVGPPGVGKTALAIEAGHAAREAAWFPGGAVYLDLHGYDGAALPPEQALASALGALGIAAERIPAGLDEAAAFYRSLLDGMDQPVLIIADNAWPTAQVLPLLPGAARHRLLVTSRHTMTQIRARRLTLAELDEAGAVELLDAALRVSDQDDGRITADRAGAARLAGSCGYLPLALTIAAAALEVRPGMSVAELASRLADPRTRLDLLDRDAGDAGASGEAGVRAAFGFSYQLLAPGVRRVFRLCAASPGPDLATDAAVVLAGDGDGDDGDADAGIVVSALDELDRAHLIIPSADRGRWHMHDLLRDYGGQLADREAVADGREQAYDRLLGHYLDRVQRAVQSLVLSSGTGQEAITWFEHERLNLMAATALAAQTPEKDAAFVLPRALLDLSVPLGHAKDAKTLARICLDSAERRGDPLERGTALTNFGQIEEMLGHADTAIPVFHEAIAVLRGLDDSAEELPLLLGCALCGLSGALLASGERNTAIATLEEAVAESRRSGIEALEMIALGRLGTALADGERYDEAIDAHRRAVAVADDSDSDYFKGAAFLALGHTLCDAKSFPEAIAQCRQAAGLFRAMGASFLEAVALTFLADALWGAGLKDASFESQNRVVELMRQTDEADAEGNALVSRGDRLRSASRYADAVPDYGRAIELFRSVADRGGEGDAQESLGHAYYGLKQYRHARAAYEQAGIVYDADGDRTSVARVVNSQGNSLRRLGEFPAAIELHLRAADLFRTQGKYKWASTAIKSLSLSLAEIHGFSVDGLLPSDGEPRQVAMALVNFASALLDLNRKETAVSVAERAIALAHGLGEEAIEARALGAAGCGLAGLGKDEGALEAHRRDLALSINLQDRREEGIARGNVGFVLHKLGRLDEAEGEWREACRIFDDRDEPENHGWVLDGLGDALRGLGRDEEAATAYEQAIAVLGPTADRRTQAWATFSLASIWSDRKDYERAAPGLARAARLAWDADLSALCGVAWRRRALAVLHLGWQRIRGRAERLDRRRPPM